MRTIIGLAIALMAVGCHSPVPKVPTKEQLSSQYAHEMRLEFGLNLIENKIGEKRVSFDFYHYAEVEALQARFLIHSAAKELMKRMSIEKNDLAITISFIDPISHQRYKEDKIASVTLHSGRIYYSVYNSVNECLEEVLQEDLLSL